MKVKIRKEPNLANPFQYGTVEEEKTIPEAASVISQFKALSIEMRIPSHLFVNQVTMEIGIK
jgi:hypothetical protein